MKNLLLITFSLFPILIFSQNIIYQDTVEMQSGLKYPCYITEINENNMKILYGDSISLSMIYLGLNKIVLKEKGEIYNISEGMIYKEIYLEKILSKRNGLQYKQRLTTPKHRYRPGDHELLLMPTAFTMNKGSSYLSDYDLFFLNYTFAVTSRTHVGLFTLFPIIEIFIYSFSIGVKQNYFHSEFYDAACWITYSPGLSKLTFGNVFSIKNNAASFHFGMGGIKKSGSTGIETIYMVGSNIDISEKTSILFEFTNFNRFIEEGSAGILSIGMRFRVKNIAWEFGGIHPGGGDDVLLLFPVLKATLMF